MSSKTCFPYSLCGFLISVTLIVTACAMESIPSGIDPYSNAFQSANQGVTVVRFALDEAADYVIAAHPISNYDGRHMRFLCDESAYRLCRTRPDEWFGYSSPLLAFCQDELQVLRHSPYIPLGDGYYLIDWRWEAFLPLSTVSYYAPSTQVLREWINSHCTLTAIPWAELNSLSQSWDMAQQPVPVKELWRITYAFLDRQAGTPKANQAVYFSGMKQENIYFGQGSAAQYDSLQNVFQQTVLPVIQSCSTIGADNALSTDTNGWSRITWE